MPRPLPDTPPAQERPRLSIWQKLAYGFGDLNIAIRISAFQFYLLPFYTDVVLLPPWLAGLGKMVGFAWDGVNDPITGYVSDRTRTRLGRRRPFLLGSAIPLGFCFGLLWSPPGHLGPALGFFYLVAAYLVLDTFFSLYTIPYLALGAELSRDYHERTQLQAARAFFHILGLFAGGVIPGLVIREFASNPPSGFAVMGFGIGAAMAVVALVTGAMTRELPPSSLPEPPHSWRAFRTDLTSTLRNRAFRVLIVTFALLLLGGGIQQTLVPYAFAHWLRMPQMVTSVIFTYMLASVVSLPFWARLSQRVGKDRALRLCMLWSVVILSSQAFLLAPDMSLLRLRTFLVAAGIGNGGWAVLPSAITADVVDYDELYTHRRREGAYFGIWTLVMKWSQAVAAGLVGGALQLLGYVPNQTQTAATILGIKVLYGPLPAAMILAAFFVFLRFPVTRERHQHVQAELARRRALLDP
jgi:GPH family glycoside/pentoside/hexuronide:cation symporter